MATPLARREVRSCPVCGQSFRRPVYKLLGVQQPVCSRACHAHLPRHPSQGAARRWVSADGYVFVWVGRDHPMAREDGYVAEHRLVMSHHLGRPLVAGERIAWRNGERTDNRLQNLVLLAPRRRGAV